MRENYKIEQGGNDMSCSCRNQSNGCNNGSSGGSGISLVGQLSRYIGATVTVFTTSGGASGNGFTGVLLSVNAAFIRLVTDFGAAPMNPLGDDLDNPLGVGLRNRSDSCRPVGSVVDIPIDRIAAFCHNAL